jgi:hypothetical protein
LLEREKEEWLRYSFPDSFRFLLEGRRMIYIKPRQGKRRERKSRRGKERGGMKIRMKRKTMMRQEERERERKARYREIW